MSERLVAGLSKSKNELESGLRDAEAELARTEEYCRKLEELIAVGRATLHAATQANIQPSAPTVVPVQMSRVDPTPTPDEDMPSASEDNGASALRKRLTEQADKSSPASRTA